MDTTNSTKQTGDGQKAIKHSAAAAAPIYGLGIFGAWAYYLTHASSVWMGVVGIIKGLFWPTVLVYELMKFLKL